MTEYVDDELPLPPFAELFGEGLMPNKRKLKKYRENPQADETTGRWTPEEHRLFLEGIMLYGKDWKKMQPLIKSRSLVQIRTHAQKVFKKIGLKKAFLMGGNKKAKTNVVNVNRDGDAAPQRMDADEFDGDDTLVGAEELQLLQQMSAQMMQEEDEELQRRQRQQPSHHPQNQPSNEFIHLTAANIGMTLPSASSVGTSSSGAGNNLPIMSGLDSAQNPAGGTSLLPEHAFHGSYPPSFSAYSGNSDYGQLGYASNNHEQGVNVILQYANSGEAQAQKDHAGYGLPQHPH
eukprot:CAMPEP_0184999824 /NCGR_PEP_ID=MMETSP1098-20130426/66536_1 /TAXON_ID=89044 /ORGANISM="Spumella elongata, Strain CCAP 955/1" /LENGTH=289 /DNA_ID=CAMNT_0027526897 /DNA_START=32 /DNA_END=901 /DNA_ORIENTATION=+